MTIALRPYQERALTELYGWLERHPAGNPIVDACVGAGKSVIIAELCRRAIAEFPQTRIVMCVASRELCQQNMEKLLTVWPDAPAGVCSASLGSKDLQSQIVFATIGSIANYANELGRVDMLLIDECHNVNPKEQGQYRTFISKLQQYGSPYLCVIGFTGTPFRGDGVWLHHGETVLFQGIATQVSMTELLDLGFLAPLVVDRETPQLADTSQVRIQAGDYVVSQLEDVMIDEQIVQSAIDDLVLRGQNRKKWLVFCVTIKHAVKVLEALISRGIVADMITGETPSAQRANTIQQYKRGNLRCLVNVACLTTGFDAPETDLIALLRPTKSPVLYVQIAGRGMRTAPDKVDCMWLDYTSTTSDLGPVNRIKGRKKTRKIESSAGMPQKECEQCGNPNPIQATECQDCGHKFPIAAAHLTQPMDALPLTGFQPPKTEWFNVREVYYSRHPGRDDKPDTMRVDYDCELQQISEWKCFEHGGHAFRMAANWWAERWTGDLFTPTTIAGALQHAGQLRQPTRIGAHRDGKFWRVTQYDFSARSEDELMAVAEIDDDVPF